jgi:ATP-dependent Clp protease ATP-binding subunit ClpC
VDTLLPSIVGALVVTALVFALRRSQRRRAPPAPVSPPVLAPQPQPVPRPPEPLPALLRRLSDILQPRTDQSAHPREMVDWPEFQAVVDAFARPDATLDLLRQYACGANWPLACAALVALRRHPQRNALAAGILTQLPNIRPWTLFFALHYLAALEPRPPVGAAVAAAPNWWAGNLVIPDFFREYFEKREALKDEPSFGDTLQSGQLAAAANVEALLAKVEHPFSGHLLDELRRWQANRIDRQFLTSFGRFWMPDQEEALLVEPASWRETLDQAERAVLNDPPRSILVAGEPRTGKTAFLRLLARRLRKSGCSVFEASGVELQADQIYIGQLEGRIRQLVAELHWRKRVVWCVTDLLQTAESGTHKGQSASILDQILPAVAAGRLVLFGEASPSGAVRLLQLRPSLRSAFEVCRLQPMSEEEAAALALAVAAQIERLRRFRIGPQAIAAALELAQHYLGSGQLPGVLFELLRRAASQALAQKASELGSDHLLATLSQMTGLPRAILDDQERLDLAAMRQFFASRVMGQDEAVAAVVDRIAMLKAGLVDPDRPVGVFLFAGPTGTGKTELAKTLADFLFGSPDRMARLDMSEFQTAQATEKILGSGDPRQTDSLIDRIRKQPFSVVLLDEFEKAHPNIWDLFLQIFDDGRLSDATGRVGDFRHAIIILTANLGATAHRGAGMGFLPDGGAYEENQVLRAMAQTFRPEFINRLDKVIVFRPLSRELMRSILRKELAEILDRRGLKRRDWAVEWEASAIEFLLDKGFSAEMGARPLKRAIDQHLLAPLAATLVEHRFPEGDQFLFVRSNGKAIEVEFVDPDAAPETPPEAEPPPARVSLPAMILRPLGTAAEAAALAEAWSGIAARLAAADWSALKDRLLAETADPGFWTRPERQAVLARRELMDRIGEAAGTAERLMRRFEASGTRTAQISRELIGRVALQLHLVQQGLADAIEGAPVDALVTVEPALDGAADAAAQAAWCERLLGMYRQWAKRRHLQLSEHAPPGRGSAILQIAGFGAFRTLNEEAGLHILDDPELEEGRRTVARVKAAPGPLEEPAPAEAYRSLARLLSRAGEGHAVVRRYRGGGAPLVRDVKGGWRSGRLAAVLGGDFDLIGAVRGGSNADA